MNTSAPPFSKTVSINAAASKIWALLTEPELMNQWMSETEIQIITDWKVGSSIIIKGPWYKTSFENKGTVLRFDPEQALSYTHLSSLSRLPDAPESYTTLEFTLKPEGDETLLTVTAYNFPTEAIYRHIAFYWNVAPHLIKKLAEA